jgi:hypothetical protein
MKRLFLVTSLLVLALLTAVHARTWQVPSQCPTIQTGLDSAAAGDTVLVAPATYYEHDIIMKSGVSLISEGGRESTTIHGQRMERCILCDGVDTTTVIKGFTITRGYVLHLYDHGGGILCVNGASPLITDNEISKCQGEHGGGIAVMDSSSPRIEFNYIHHDSARGTTGHGGGIILAPGGAPYVGHVEISDNVISDNYAKVRGGGIQSNYFDVVISGNEISGNVTEEENGGGIALENTTGEVTGNRIIGNDAHWQGGGLMLYLSSPSVTQNTIRDNTAGNRGGGIHCDGSSPTIDRCIIADNKSFDLGYDGAGGAICCQALSSPMISNCLIVGNTSEYSAAGIHCDNVGDNPDIIGNTIAYNISKDAYGCYGGIACWNGASPAIEKNIIVGNSRTGVYITDPSCAITLDCNDVWGNLPVNYGRALRENVDTTSCITADPLFCDPDNGDYHLEVESPCLDDSTCGLIGAYGLGCWFAAMTISDIPDDQGGQVLIEWDRICYDRPGSETTITNYSIWRRAEGAFVSNSTDHIAGRRTPLFNEALWDSVAEVVADSQATYSAVCPTLCDSTETGGICWSVFFVRAHALDPVAYFDTNPDSAYSVDNLAPLPPENLSMATPTDLVWDQPEDPDVEHFSVYGSANPDYDASADFIGETPDTTMDVAGYVYDYYHVTATDFSGNEGDASSVENTYAGTQAESMPAIYALMQNRPNPFETATAIRFDLPEANYVNLTVFDVEGRAVARLTDGVWEAGQHTVTWGGVDQSGNCVSPGVYFVRMEAGEFSAIAKMTLLR